MGISQFPPASGGGLSNDFILDRNNTNNTTFQLPREFEAGGYALVTSTNDSSFDVYLLNAAGSSVGYTNGSSIVASEAFDTVVVYGLSTAATVQFAYRGPSTNATSTGLEPGAAAFLTSVFPADLPNIDDTTTVAGGNFASNVAITFESGTVVLPAKNVVVGSSTALVVTRPDNLIQDNSPYNLRAVNPGITQPSGSNANVLSGTITAGQDPTFITSALITGANPNVAFSTSILVSDSDGTVVNWQITSGTIPPGLSLATATGAISGTPTTAGDYYFTVRITDDGQNTNSREFNLPVGPLLSGGSGTVVGGTTYRWFTSSSSLVIKNANSLPLQYLVIAGGGNGNTTAGTTTGSFTGGGGAGGLLNGTATITSSLSTVVVTVGGGGANDANGSNSVFTGYATAFGGGKSAANGGSGGGALSNNTTAIGSGTSGQGYNGGMGTTNGGGGGGGAGAVGGNAPFTAGGLGGNGLQFGAWASAINIIYDAGFFGGGGGGAGQVAATYAGGLGGGGRGARDGAGEPAANGSVNSGGGGGGRSVNVTTAGSGGSGLVVVRFS